MQRPIRSLTTPLREQAPLPLREHRLRARVSLDDIIVRTKISRRFLEAIESGDYRQLPGGIFAVNYIRQYAEAICYDPADLLEHYRKSVEQPPAPEPEVPQVSQTHSIVRLARSLLLS